MDSFFGSSLSRWTRLAAAFQIIAPRDYVRSRDCSKFLWPPDAGKPHEFADGLAVCSFGMRVVEIPEPLDLG